VTFTKDDGADEPWVNQGCVTYELVNLSTTWKISSTCVTSEQVGKYIFKIESSIANIPGFPSNENSVTTYF
jgi:hypothetical protein